MKARINCRSAGLWATTSAARSSPATPMVAWPMTSRSRRPRRQQLRGPRDRTDSYWDTQTSGHSESAVGGHVHAVPVSLAAYDDLIKGQDRNAVGQRRLRGKSEHLSVAIRIAIGSPDYALSPLLPPRLCHAVSDTRLGEDVGSALRVVSQLVAEIRHVGAQEM